MRYLILLVCLFLAGPAFASDIKASWDYDFDKDQPCTGTVLVDCVEGFEFRLESGQILVNTGLPANPTGIMVGINTVFSGFIGYGNKGFQVFAKAVSANGVPVYSLASNTDFLVVKPSKALNHKTEQVN